MARLVFFFLLISIISFVTSNNSTNSTINSTNNSTNSTNNDDRVQLEAPKKSLLITITSYLIEKMNMRPDEVMQTSFLRDVMLILLSHEANEHQTALLKVFVLEACKDFPTEMYLLVAAVFLGRHRSFSLYCS